MSRSAEEVLEFDQLRELLRQRTTCTPGRRAVEQLVFSFLSNNMGSKGHEATDALDALSIAMMEEFDAAGAACCVKAQ